MPTQWSTSSRLQPAGGARRRRDLAVAGREDAVVVAPVDERVERLAVGPDRRPAEHRRPRRRRARSARAPRPRRGRRLAPGRLDVGDRERDVVDAVAVRADVLGDLAVRGQRRGEHEPDVVLDHDVARPVADLRLEPAEGDRREAPQRAVVGRRLAGVADPELDVVDAVERQEVGRLGVGVRIDPGARLVGGPAGQRLGHRASPLRAGRPRGRRRAAAATARGVGQWRHRYAPRATLATMTTTDLLDRPDRLADARAAYAALAPAWPRASHGRWPRPSGPSPRRRGGRARSSPTSPRCCRSGSASWSASWTATARAPVPFGRIADDPLADRLDRPRPVAAVARPVRARRRRLARLVDRLPR